MGHGFPEAGHAVMAYLRGRRFRIITIEPDEDEGSAGHVEFSDSKTIINILQGPGWHSRTFLEKYPEIGDEIVWRSVLSRMAGFIAQDMGVPGSVEEWQWEFDKGIILDMLLNLDPEDGWMKAKTEVQQALKQNWNLVETLVETLLEKKTLTGKEVRKLFQARQERALP